MMMRRSGRVGALLAVAGVMGAAGCEAGGGGEGEAETFEPLVAFDTAVVALETDEDTIRITVELADTDARRQYGLMERPDLPPDRGMLFTYAEPQAPSDPFWMYRTRMPLDIAFLDEEGRIVVILGMEPCRSPNPELCRRYAPGVPYMAALEVARGRLEELGVGVGDRVRLVANGPE